MSKKPAPRKLVDNNLHAELIAKAEVEIRLHVETECGEPCFNLFTFLEALELTWDGLAVGKFELDSTAVARYVWCCLKRCKGETPDGNTFRGMPILD